MTCSSEHLVSHCWLLAGEPQEALGCFWFIPAWSRECNTLNWCEPHAHEVHTVHVICAGEQNGSAGSSGWAVSACDFQWCGGGLAVRDVVYLLYTSVQPEVVWQQEESLLRYMY